MKVCLYAGDMNLNRHDKNVYKNLKEKKKISFRNQNGEKNSVPNVLYSYGLFSKYNVLNNPPVFLFSIEVP